MNYAHSIIMAMLLLLSACATPKQIETSYHRPISDREAFLIYESRAEQPLPVDELARICLKYDKPKDEFEEREKLAFHKNKISEYFQVLRKSDNLMVYFIEDIAEYDFDRQGFPLAINQDMFIKFDNGYALQFTNADQASFLPVAPEKAKAVSKNFIRRDFGRKCVTTIKSHIVGLDKSNLNDKPYKIIKAKIHEVVVNACHSYGVPTYKNCDIPVGTISIDMDEVNYLKNW